MEGPSQLSSPIIAPTKANSKAQSLVDILDQLGPTRFLTARWLAGAVLSFVLGGEVTGGRRLARRTVELEPIEPIESIKPIKVVRKPVKIARQACK
jgi:hypothetical protein